MQQPYAGFYVNRLIQGGVHLNCYFYSRTAIVRDFTANLTVLVKTVRVNP